MFQSREEVRQVYLTVWQKMQQKSLLEPMEAIIADVIKLHPEYHALLDKGEHAKEQDFTLKMAKLILFYTWACTLPSANRQMQIVLLAFIAPIKK